MLNPAHFSATLGDTVESGSFHLVILFAPASGLDEKECTLIFSMNMDIDKGSVLGLADSYGRR